MSDHNLLMGELFYEVLKSEFEEEAIKWANENIRKELESKPVKIMNEDKLKIDIIHRSESYGDSRKYGYYINKGCVFSINQVPFPSCCGIAILKDLSMSFEISQEDFNKCIDNIISDLKNNDRFSKVIFYTTKNSRENKMFSMYPGITILDSFINRRSENILSGFEIDILIEEEAVNSFDNHREGINSWQPTISQCFIDAMKTEAVFTGNAFNHSIEHYRNASKNEDTIINRSPGFQLTQQGVVDQRDIKF